MYISFNLAIISESQTSKVSEMRSPAKTTVWTKIAVGTAKLKSTVNHPPKCMHQLKRSKVPHHLCHGLREVVDDQVCLPVRVLHHVCRHRRLLRAGHRYLRCHPVLLHPLQVENQKFKQECFISESLGESLGMVKDLQLINQS